MKKNIFIKIFVYLIWGIAVIFALVFLPGKIASRNLNDVFDD